MASLEELKTVRLQKLNILKEFGMDPYPTKVSKDFNLCDLSSDFTKIKEENDTKEVSLVGRIMSLRGQGAILFASIFDGTGKFQAVFKKDEIEENLFKLFNNVIDIGDFIQVSGNLFVTERGQESILVKEWKIVTKSLLPLPSEYYGVEDNEERFRRRYLDILLDPNVHQMIEKRSIFWNTMRTYLLDKGFVEVETPVLENTTGGAEARPFITHHNALDMEVYLRISAGELWQKKLLVGGMPRTFEIGRIFRNEGISNEHLQDYTQLEYYMAYADYNLGMDMTKELYRLIAQKTFGTTKFKIKGFDIDLASEWEVYHFSELIEKKFGINPITEIYSKTNARVTESDLKEICESAGIAYEPAEENITRTIDNLWKVLRKEIAGPGFLVGVPVSMEPLAKRNRENPNVVERFQVILAGSEMGKGFSELNDPVDQRSRFEQQQKLRDAGDEEAQMADMEFVEALEYGMPPAFGFGLSERLFSFLMDKPVRETQIFPLMKPKE